MMDAAQCGGNLPRFQEPLQLELGWTGRYYEVSVVMVLVVVQGAVVFGGGKWGRKRKMNRNEEPAFTHHNNSAYKHNVDEVV